MEVKMKTIKYCITIMIILLIVPINLLAQDKEIPITTSSKEALNFFLMGRDKLENFETTAAASLFDKAIQKDPNFAMAYLYRSNSGGGLNIFRQNLNKAVSLLGKVTEGEKLQIQYAQESANGNGLKQKELLDQLLKLFPKDKRVHSTAGVYYYGINDFSNALMHFTKSTELDSKYASSYNMIGYCQSALNNYPEAEKAFQTYIKLIPDKAAAYDSYAELLLNMGKYDESVTQYKKAIEKDPDFSTSLAGLGNNYIFKGDYATARKYYQNYFDKASNINGKLAALYWKSTAFIHEGNIEKAVNTYDEYRALAEKENLITNATRSYVYQGYIYAETGNPAEGIKYFEKSNELLAKSNLPEADKENSLTQSMLWHFYFLTANNELEKATAEAEKCKLKVESRKNPYEETWLNSFSAFYEIKKGNYDKAIEYLSKKDIGNDPWSWYCLAVAYEKKGDKQNASKLYEKIAKWNVNSMDLALVRKRAMAALKN